MAVVTVSVVRFSAVACTFKLIKKIEAGSETGD